MCNKLDYYEEMDASVSEMATRSEITVRKSNIYFFQLINALLGESRVYNCVPPQVFISRLNQFIHENEPQAFSVQIRWESVRGETPDEEESQRTKS